MISFYSYRLFTSQQRFKITVCFSAGGGGGVLNGPQSGWGQIVGFEFSIAHFQRVRGPKLELIHASN